ncbi:hypothetical protein L6452_37882 [Arctium lappa]|uniref:Uncharacterized protein n=1 Tax=Arctium lappa TaxID=4217 RepID=A0ACB8Y8C2_ARCLA|nr:hypothetical protein L6452_37882 [Arctium lappa]
MMKSTTINLAYLQAEAIIPGDPLLEPENQLQRSEEDEDGQLINPNTKLSSVESISSFPGYAQPVSKFSISLLNNLFNIPP